MIRDTFFSAPRFVNLCRKEMGESWKANLLRFVMMYGIGHMLSYGTVIFNIIIRKV